MKLFSSCVLNVFVVREVRVLNFSPSAGTAHTVPFWSYVHPWYGHDRHFFFTVPFDSGALRCMYWSCIAIVLLLALWNTVSDSPSILCESTLLVRSSSAIATTYQNHSNFIGVT